MFQLQVLHLFKYIYIYIFDDGYKGDPQRVLLKASFMRTTIYGSYVISDVIV